MLGEERTRSTVCGGIVKSEAHCVGGMSGRNRTALGGRAACPQGSDEQGGDHRQPHGAPQPPLPAAAQPRMTARDHKGWTTSAWRPAGGAGGAAPTLPLCTALMNSE